MPKDEIVLESQHKNVGGSEESLKEYLRYLKLSNTCNSQPIMFGDAFEHEGLPEGSGLDRRESDIKSFYSGKPIIKKITTLGKSTVTLVFGIGAVVENVLIDAPKGDLTVFFAPHSELKGLVIQSFGPGNYLHFGCGTKITTGNFLLQGNESCLFIGHDCMFSTNVYIRTSDSHPIFSYDTGQRINYDSSVIIGDHVWVGREVSIGKGVVIHDDVVIGQGALVTGKCEKSACYAGVPAKKIREGTTWERANVEHAGEVKSTYQWRAHQVKVNNFLADDEPFGNHSEVYGADMRQKYLIKKDYPWITLFNRS